MLGLSVLMVPKLFWRQFGGRAPAAPSLPMAGFSLREKQIPGGGRALSMHGNPMSRTHPVPAPGGSSGLAHSQEHLAYLCCQIHATRKTNMDTVYHLKVNLVHVKGAGNTTQTIHNIHFPTQWPRASAEVRFVLPFIFLISVPVPTVQSPPLHRGLKHPSFWPHIPG